MPHMHGSDPLPVSARHLWGIVFYTAYILRLNRFTHGTLPTAPVE